MKSKAKYVILAVLVLCNLFTVGVFAASSAPTITRDYEFKADNLDSLNYDCPKKVIEDSTEYTLSSVEYEVLDVYSVTKSIRTSDKNSKDWPQAITENGMELICDNDSIVWKEETNAPLVVTKGYSGTAPSTITATKTIGSKEIEVVCELTDTQNAYQIQTYNVPAVYTRTAKDAMYTLDGRPVEITDQGPAWKGYETDIANGLSLPNGSSINGGSWTDQETFDGENYVRHATFQVTGPMAYTLATYTETDETRKSYTGTATYQAATAINGNNAVAHATYVPAKSMSLAMKVAIGVGGLAVAGLIAASLMILAKNRKRKE